MSEATPKQPFYDQLIQQAQMMATVSLAEHPELESVAIVYSYRRGNSDLPFAIIQGQNGRLTHPTEIMHMAQQLTRVWSNQLQAGMACVESLDNYMAEQATKLQSLQEQVNAGGTQPGGDASDAGSVGA